MNRALGSDHPAIRQPFQAFLDHIPLQAKAINTHLFAELILYLVRFAILLNIGALYVHMMALSTNLWSKRKPEQAVMQPYFADTLLHHKGSNRLQGQRASGASRSEANVPRTQIYQWRMRFNASKAYSLLLTGKLPDLSCISYSQTLRATIVVNSM